MSYEATQLAILANAFHAIADEMGAILTRSAFSTIVREARDCATALLDAEGNVIAQAEMIPIHNGGLSEAFRASAAQLDLSGVGPDHAILLNDPYAGGQHLNDFILFQPIIIDGALLGWAGNTAHHLDVGGGGAGINIDANELIQEGIIIPPLLIEMSRDLHGGPVDRLIFANVRTAELGRGDFYAQLAANRTGVERVTELAARVGTQTVRQAMAETLLYAERRMRAAIATIPDGRWTGEASIDADVRGTEPLTVRVAVTVADGAMTLDFAGTAPQVSSMFNSSRSSSLASAISAVRSVLADKTIPANDGCNRALTIRMPEGSLINPSPGRPVRARIEASYRVLDAIHDALSQAIPQRVPAQGYNSTTGLYLTQARDNAPMRIYGDVLGGGYGGAPGYDGAHALAGVLSSSRNTPIESIEQIHPHLRMRHYRLVPDSCGAGEFRGGVGFSRAIEILEDGVVLSYYSDHFLYPPRGKSGGGDAATGSLRIWRGEEVINLPTTDVVPLKKGDIVELSVGGGAGWGDPARRAPERIAADLADGIITRAFAAEHYPGRPG
ncbi:MULTISPECIES: hydantoinase B/oxoprolinase family protein [unclassified Chelatococcus]|uniref:hydantoinase B/oxoprolinase family protein n=1 Tax=unclassified Chelatococcus TaxID=2638111 RepID=UPI001BD0016E|nr:MULTISPECIES: hydantoinase B/oxoprolinase family protein [unclassified Chelatococcus]MBS7700674.1 hydantoinase B/oxoprolinase family protein [Chelatococcus sp. YT9]MBX3559105.1 hydantoinase B/oxoprolinase family protein [Chelatococcus sp.]